MKRFSCLLLFLCLLPVFALADVSDFSFLDEWMGFFTSSDVYFNLYESGDYFTSKSGKTVFYPCQDKGRPAVEVDAYGTGELEKYSLIDIGGGFRILYRYNEYNDLYALVSSETENAAMRRIYDDTSCTSMLLTENRILAENGQLDYAIYGSNLYLLQKDAYLKCPITILSDDAFMIEAEENAKKAYVFFVRSSLFEQ